MTTALTRAGHKVYAPVGVEGGASGSEFTVSVDPQDGSAVKFLQLGLGDQASADEAIRSVVESEGRLDVVVHNVGLHTYGITEAFAPAQMAALFDINVLGSQRVNIAALPHMRRRESGLLLWVGSTATRGGLTPFMGPYAATMAAVDLLAQSYALELTRFGIESSIVLAGTPSPDEGASLRVAPSRRAVSDAYGRYNDLLDDMPGRLAELLPEELDDRVVAGELRRIIELPVGRRPF
ncbi:MAG TPA: SDR family NAD(P)-dependent oxidoreductase, partial [Microlunatus sp.]